MVLSLSRLFADISAERVCEELSFFGRFVRLLGIAVVRLSFLFFCEVKKQLAPQVQTSLNAGEALLSQGELQFYFAKTSAYKINILRRKIN